MDLLWISQKEFFKSIIKWKFFQRSPTDIKLCGREWTTIAKIILIWPFVFIGKTTKPFTFCFVPFAADTFLRLDKLVF